MKTDFKVKRTMFTEEDDTAINNEYRKEFKKRKNAKIYSIL